MPLALKFLKFYNIYIIMCIKQIFFILIHTNFITSLNVSLVSKSAMKVAIEGREFAYTAHEVTDDCFKTDSDLLGEWKNFKLEARNFMYKNSYILLTIRCISFCIIVYMVVYHYKFILNIISFDAEAVFGIQLYGGNIFSMMITINIIILLISLSCLTYFLLYDCGQLLFEFCISWFINEKAILRVMNRYIEDMRCNIKENVDRHFKQEELLLLQQEAPRLLRIDLNDTQPLAGEQIFKTISELKQEMENLKEIIYEELCAKIKTN